MTDLALFIASPSVIPETCEFRHTNLAAKDFVYSTSYSSNGGVEFEVV